MASFFLASAAGGTLATNRYGYWVTPEANSELGLITEDYGRELLEQAAADGQLTAQNLWAAHRRRLEQTESHSAAHASAIDWGNVASVVAAAGIAVYGILIVEHSLAVYLALAVYLVLTLAPALLKGRGRSLLGHLPRSWRRRRPVAGPDAGDPLEQVLAQILSLLTRSILASAAFRRWQGHSYDQPVSLEAIRESYSATGLLDRPTSRQPSVLAAKQAIDNRARAIGISAILLPLVLTIVNLAYDGRVPDSLSAFYYSPFKTGFIIGFCVLGLLLISYKGSSLFERAVTTVAGAAFIGAGLFPTAAAVSVFSPNRPQGSSVVHYIHLVCLYTAFITMAFMAWRFGQPPVDGTATLRRRRENAVARSCAICVLVCIISLPLIGVLEFPQALFWLESLAMYAIGIAWLVRSCYSSPVG